MFNRFRSNNLRGTFIVKPMSYNGSWPHSVAYTAVVSLFLCGTRECNAKSPVEYCPPYTAVVASSFDVNRPFLQYDLVVSTDVSGRKIVIITGDTITLDSETLGALIRSPAAADPTISAIEFHARRVVFKDMISLIRAQITVYAQTIEFADGASLSLLPDSRSLVRLVAQTVILSPSGFRHFDIRARQPVNGIKDRFDDVNEILQIKTREIKVGGANVTESAAVSTLARRFTRYPITDFTNKIQLSIGQQGYADWLSETKAHGKWIPYSTAVMQAAFRVAPFEPSVKAALRTRINELRPIVEAAASGTTFYDVNVIANSIDRGVDLEGNGPAYATSLPLSRLLDDLTSYQANGKSLQQLDSYISIMKSSIDGAPEPRAALDERVSSFNSEIASAVTAFQNGNNDLVRLQTDIERTNKTLTELEAAYAIRQHQLVEHHEQLKESAANQAQVISVLATAASIATTAYTGSPQTGAAVGGVIYAVGASQDGGVTFKSLAAGYQFAAAMKEPLTSVSSALGKLSASRTTYEGFIDSFKIGNITIKKEVDVPVKDPKPGEPTSTKLSRDDALKNLSADATSLKDGLSAVLDVYNKFKETTSPLSEALEHDDDLDKLGVQIADALEVVKALVQRTESSQRLLQGQSVKLIGSSERLSELTSLPVSNEERRRSFGRLALVGARDSLASYTATIDRLRRLSIVEYRAPLPVDPVQIESVYAMEKLDSDFDPTSVLAPGATGAQYVSLLSARKTQVSLLAGIVGQAAKQQLYDFVELQGRAPLISYPQEQFTEGRGAPASFKIFISQLNSLIQQEFKARSSRNLGDLQMRKLELPFDIKSKIDQRFPARLLNVAVTDVVRSGTISGGDLTFTLETERVGNLRKADRADGLTDRNAKPDTRGSAMQCFSVDLRSTATPPSSYNTPYRYSIDQIDSGAALQHTSALSFWYLTSLDAPPSTGRTMLLSYPPAETRMYLSVSINPNASWVAAPVIKKLSVTAEVFQ